MMTSINRTPISFPLILLPLILLASCGGGGSQSSPDDPQDGDRPIAEIIADDPTKFKTSELRQHYEAYARSLYTGEAARAEIWPSTVQLFSSLIMGDRLVVPPLIPPHIWETLGTGQSGAQRAKRDVSHTFFRDSSPKAANAEQSTKSVADGGGVLSCMRHGSITVNELLNDKTGVMAAEFDNCGASGGLTLNGRGAIVVDSISRYGFVDRGSVYFDQVEVSAEGSGAAALTISGYSEFRIDENIFSEGFSQDYNFRMLYEYSSGLQILDTSRRAVGAITEIPPSGYFEGEMFHGELGSVQYEPPSGHRGARFVGKDGKQAVVEFSDGLVKFFIDNNAELDYGRYFESYDDFLSYRLALTDLVPRDQLNVPPFISPPHFLTSDVDTTNIIQVRRGHLSDPDSPADQLVVVAYNWYINGLASPHFPRSARASY
jgi:hypothetical protein